MQIDSRILQNLSVEATERLCEDCNVTLKSGVLRQMINGNFTYTDTGLSMDKFVAGKPFPAHLHFLAKIITNISTCT